MAIVHCMGHGYRRGSKSPVGKVVSLVGALFIGTTALSLLMLGADWLLTQQLRLNVLSAEWVRKVYSYAWWWIDWLSRFVRQEIAFLSHFAPANYSGRWLELLPEIGKLTLAVIVIVGALMVVFRRSARPRYKPSADGSREAAGQRGEADALKVLKALPDDTHIFTNLEFEKRGHHETDLIVVAPAGVTVCEVKNWSGRVIYDEMNDCDVTRVNSQGEVSQMHSPVHQVIAHYETLRDALRERGINANPRGMVLMMHPDVRLEGFEHSRVPVLKQPTIAEVKRHLGNAHLSKAQIDQTVRALKKIAV